MEILLIRHGKPTNATSEVVNAVNFTQWIRNYNASDVSPHSRPSKAIDFSAHYVVSSDLKRAMHSAVIYTSKPAQQKFKLFREMEIPRYKLPFKLNTWTWVYLNRVLWILGVKGSFETYKQAKQRAELASQALINLSAEKSKVAIFGHGYMNHFIAKSLVNKGWKLNEKDNGFWGVIRLTTHDLNE